MSIPRRRLPEGTRFESRRGFLLRGRTFLKKRRTWSKGKGKEEKKGEGTEKVGGSAFFFYTNTHTLAPSGGGPRGKQTDKQARWCVCVGHGVETPGGNPGYPTCP